MNRKDHNNGAELDPDQLAGVSGGVDVKPPNVEPETQPQVSEESGGAYERKGKPGKGVLN